MGRSKLAITVCALCTVLAACTAADDAAPRADPTEIATDAPRSTEPRPTSEGAESAPESDSVEAAPAATVAESCGFGAGHTPELVEVVQIPGDGRESNPSALANPLNATFPEPLVEIERILSGGPPPDGIPPIDSPVFQTVGSVDWLRCTEPVVVLDVDGQTRAYPVQIMTWHEIVNDTFGDTPVAVTFCPLCNSALAYRRDLEGRTVSFGTSGQLYNSSLVMYDRETESMWTHFDGSAVVGTLTGTELELLAIQTMSWANFIDANPGGLVLTRDTGFDRDYGRNPYEGYDDVGTTPFLFDGELDERLAAKQRVVTVRSDEETVAVVLDAVAEAGVLEIEVGGTPMVVWHLPGTSSALESGLIADGRDVGATGVFLPVLDGVQLTFRRDGENFVDRETGSRWNIAGRAIDGVHSGRSLVPVEHLDTFWFAIAAFEPDTRTIP